MIGADPGESQDTEGVKLSGNEDRGTALKFAVPFIFYKAEINMTPVKIITNNPMIWNKYPNHCQKVQGDVGDVYKATRDEIHKGCILLSHPLSGSVKPNVSPVKSVAVGIEEGTVDYTSVKFIEEALAVLVKMPPVKMAWTPELLQDYQVIDASLLDSAIQGLPTPYRL